MRLCFAGTLPALQLPVPNKNQAQHHFAAATMLCRCYQGISSAPCISISSVLCFVFSGKHFHSTTEDDAFEVAVAPPQTVVAQSPSAQISNAPVYSILQPGTRARPTVHTCRKAWACNHFPPHPPLSAAFTRASLNKQFTFSQAGFVPGFLSVQRPRPDRSSSVCTIVSRHHSIQNCELICK